MITSSYVVHESWTLIQACQGWEAMVVACEVIWIDERLDALGAARARQSRERRLSMTDCVSFEVMLAEGCREALADDEHFRKYGFLLPE